LLEQRDQIADGRQCGERTVSHRDRLPSVHQGCNWHEAKGYWCGRRIHPLHGGVDGHGKQKHGQAQRPSADARAEVVTEKHDTSTERDFGDCGPPSDELDGSHWEQLVRLDRRPECARIGGFYQTHDQHEYTSDSNYYSENSANERQPTHAARPLRYT